MSGKLIRDRSTPELDSWWDSVLKIVECAYKIEVLAEDANKIEKPPKRK